MTEKKDRIILATSVDYDLYEEFDEVAWQRRFRNNSEAMREAIRDWIAKDDNVDSGETKREK